MLLADHVEGQVLPVGPGPHLLASLPIGPGRLLLRHGRGVHVALRAVQSMLGGSSQSHGVGEEIPVQGVGREGVVRDSWLHDGR